MLEKNVITTFVTEKTFYTEKIHFTQKNIGDSFGALCYLVNKIFCVDIVKTLLTAL